MDSYIQRVAVRERQAAIFHLNEQLVRWRLVLWPVHTDDPITMDELDKRIVAAKARGDLLLVHYLEEYGAYALIQ